jgi:dCTP deaminase
MILSDFDLMNAIKSRRLFIHPLSEELIRENGIDLRLAGEIARHKRSRKGFVMDPTDEKCVLEGYDIAKSAKSMVVDAGEQVLLSTHEFLELPSDLVGLVGLRSAWTNHGLSSQPRIIEAGFRGTITLEVFNHAPYKIMLKPMQRFAHIVFAEASGNAPKTRVYTYDGHRGIKLPGVIR